MLLFAGVVYLDASLRTLPTYSLAVQMGSDFKHRERLRLPRWNCLFAERPVQQTARGMAWVCSES